MKEFCHQNVMNLLGVCLDAGPTPYIVLPFMENGDLLSYIKKHRESLLVTECDDIDKVHVHPITLYILLCMLIGNVFELVTCIVFACLFHRSVKCVLSCSPCVYKYQKGWSTLPVRTSYTEIWQPGTACNGSN